MVPRKFFSRRGQGNLKRKYETTQAFETTLFRTIPTMARSDIQGVGYTKSNAEVNGRAPAPGRGKKEGDALFNVLGSASSRIVPCDPRIPM